MADTIVADQAGDIGEISPTRSPKKKVSKVPGAKKIRAKELPTFTRQLASMLSAGLPVVQSLDALKDQVTHQHFKKVVEGVKTRIEGGESLSEGFTHYPDVFDDLYINLMRAGEAGGMLAETSSRVAGYLEDSARLKRKVVSAMMYPTIVTVVALLLTASMIIWIVPVFATIYSDFGAKLPAPTAMLVTVSDFMRQYVLYVVVVVVVASVAISHFKKTDKGKLFFDQMALKVPVFGDLSKKVAISRFALTYAQLMRSGVPILTSLETVSFAVGNRVLGSTIMKARDTVERGENLSVAISQDPNFPPMLVHMLKAGEKTGKVDEMLGKVAEFYDDEVESMLAGLTSLIEPLLIVFLGIMIGGIVLCMFLPIFKMHEIVAF